MKPTCHERIEVKEIVKKKCMVQAALVLLLVLCFSCAAAQEAKDLTNACIISSPDKTTDKVHDGAYTSFWQSRTNEKPHLEFQTPEGESAQYLYICFAEMPEAWSIEEEINGEWQTSIEGTTDYYHVLVALNGKNHFRLVGISEKKSYLKLNEVFVFSDGELPDWVQQWEPTPKKADLLLLVAHPDDELIWGGGHLLDDKYLVVCMTRGNDPVRSAEFKSVMEATGDKYLILSYPDKIGKDRSSWNYWKKDMEADIATVLNYKNWKQVATHNADGEYGHHHHQMTHQLVEEAYRETNCDAAFYSFGKYYVNDKVPYDLEEMPKDLYIQKRKLAKLYVSQRTTVRKMYHMLPYEYWQKEDF